MHNYCTNECLINQNVLTRAQLLPIKASPHDEKKLSGIRIKHSKSNLARNELTGSDQDVPNLQEKYNLIAKIKKKKLGEEGVIPLMLNLAL